jgi:hypothetical protein
MVVCVIALIVFAFLGIFSASHRRLAKEAFACVFRKVTLRKCETGFDTKIKLKVTKKLSKRSPKVGKFVYKYFEPISWIFTITFFVTLILSVNGLYNLYIHGTCDPHSTTCIFNPGQLSCESEHCLNEGCACEDVSCDSPEYQACEGDCSCIEQVCG